VALAIGFISIASTSMNSPDLLAQAIQEAYGGRRLRPAPQWSFPTEEAKVTAVASLSDRRPSIRVPTRLIAEYSGFLAADQNKTAEKAFQSNR
jgi:hypothetical protein